MCIKTRYVEKLADFAIISITNTFLDDIPANNKVPILYRCMPVGVDCDE